MYRFDLYTVQVCTSLCASLYSFVQFCTGLASCIFCPVGFYADEIGLSECKACPTGSTTWSKRRTDKSECMCQNGYYDAPEKITDHEYKWSQPTHVYVGCFQQCGNATAGTLLCPGGTNATARRTSEFEEMVGRMFFEFLQSDAVVLVL